MSKEAYMAAHEQLVEEYLEAHPNATWQQAYDRTADGAWDRSRDNLADAADHYRDMMKDR
jgi:hypothetical protein